MPFFGWVRIAMLSPQDAQQADLKTDEERDMAVRLANAAVDTFLSDGDGGESNTYKSGATYMLAVEVDFGWCFVVEGTIKDRLKNNRPHWHPPKIQLIDTKLENKIRVVIRMKRR